MSYGQALKLAPAFQLNGRNTFDSGGQLFAPPPNPGCEVDGPCRGGLEPKIFGLRQQHRDGLTAPRDLYGLAILGAVQQLGEAIPGVRSEEHTSELQSLMRISYAVFCLKKKT